MKKALAVSVAVFTLLALAVPATAAKGGKGKAPKVDVSIETNHLSGVHELSDLIIYYIDVSNGTASDATVQDSYSYTAVVEAKSTARLSTELYVGDVLAAVPGPGEEATSIVNTATAYVAGEAVTADSVETSVYGYDYCDPDRDGSFARPEGYSVCIWQPGQAGDWTLDVTPAPPGKKPVSIHLNVRDHVPGNWCPVEPVYINKWRGEPETLTFSLQIPQVQAGWHGEALCPDGGAGGEPFGVGTAGSFYLATYDDYQIEAYLTP